KTKIKALACPQIHIQNLLTKLSFIKNFKSREVAMTFVNVREVTGSKRLRNPCVKINCYYSNYRLIESDVPQGLDLGPLLLILYTNDIFHCSTGCKILCYADDTSITITKNTTEHLRPFFTSTRLAASILRFVSCV